MWSWPSAPDHAPPCDRWAAALADIAPIGKAELMRHFDDWGILEGVGARGRPIGPGALSHSTRLTNLANLAKRVQGRSDDTRRVRDLTPQA